MSMKRTLARMMFLAACLLATACVTAATEEEMKEMCDNLVAVRGEIDDSSAEKLAAEAKARIEREEKRLIEWKARDLKGWDDELNAKLAEAKDDTEKQQLAEEYAKKKEVTASKHDPGIAEIPSKLNAAVLDAKAKAKENKAAWEAAVKACMEAARSEGVSQKTAQCRIKAKTSDEYWNGCR